LVIVYRGTDKELEVRLAPIEAYIEVALRLRQLDPTLAVCVQTEQAEARNAVLAAIPDAIFLRDLPVTTGAVGIHRLPIQQQFGMRRIDLAIRLLAMTYLYSQFKFVVSHTGNIGLWLAIYRGHSAGFYQFDAQAVLRDPTGQVIKPQDV